MEELRKVFEARDKAFEKKTFEIFEIIHDTLVCVTNFLDDIDPICAAGTITWEDANLVDDLVVVIGMVEYTPGTTMEMDGNLITITKENLDYFQRVVHMSLPFDLVESANEEDIMKFLYNINKEKEASEFSEVVDGNPKASMEFDLTKLTDEQRQALQFFTSKGKN